MGRTEPNARSPDRGLVAQSNPLRHYDLRHWLCPFCWWCGQARPCEEHMSPVSILVHGCRARSAVACIRLNSVPAGSRSPYCWTLSAYFCLCRKPTPYSSAWLTLPHLLCAQMQWSVDQHGNLQPLSCFWQKVAIPVPGRAAAVAAGASSCNDRLKLSATASEFSLFTFSGSSA